MGLKSLIVPPLAERRLSRDTLEKNRAKYERSRAKTGEPHIIEFFHDPSDPYSQLLAKALTDFRTQHKVELRTHIIGPPAANAAPEVEKLRTYAKWDAALLARKAGIDFEFLETPPANNTAQADARLAELGHYMGGMLHYGGEWYWGLDRLHYLQDRLSNVGAGDGRFYLYAANRSFGSGPYRGRATLVSIFPLALFCHCSAPGQSLGGRLWRDA